MIYIRCIFSARRREIVLLPTPLGPTRTMSVPGAFALFAIMTPGEADILVCHLKVGQTFWSVISRWGRHSCLSRVREWGHSCPPSGLTIFGSAREARMPPLAARWQTRMSAPPSFQVLHLFF